MGETIIRSKYKGCCELNMLSKCKLHNNNITYIGSHIPNIISWKINIISNIIIIITKCINYSVLLSFIFNNIDTLTV